MPVTTCDARQDFAQEGWRLEHAATGDASTPIAIKGVVYNEMKGALSSSESIYYVKACLLARRAARLTRRQAMQALFADGPYRSYSGGEPAHIPSLTHAALKQFHSTLYHPSNARFYSYGDFPLERHLKQVQAEALSKLGPARAVPPVPVERRWTWGRFSLQLALMSVQGTTHGVAERPARRNGQRRAAPAQDQRGVFDERRQGRA